MTTYKRNRPTIRSLLQCCICACVLSDRIDVFKKADLKKKKELNAGTSLPYNTIRTSFFPGQKYVNFVRNSSKVRQKFLSSSSKDRQKFVKFGRSSSRSSSSSEVRQVRQKRGKLVRSSSDVRQKFVKSSSEVRPKFIQIRPKFVKFVRSPSSSLEVRQVRQISLTTK